MRKMKNAWTEPDNARLMQMVAAGASPIRVAAVFNRSMVSVRVQARKLGTPFPNRRSGSVGAASDKTLRLLSAAE
jgi:hypothetical protein